MGEAALFSVDVRPTCSKSITKLPANTNNYFQTLPTESKMKGTFLCLICLQGVLNFDCYNPSWALAGYSEQDGLLASVCLGVEYP